MLTLCDLEHFHNTGRSKKAELVDINDIKIDSSKPVAERMEDYFLHIKNPYFFMCGEVPVIVSFSDNGIALSEKVQGHFIRQKSQ